MKSKTSFYNKGIMRSDFRRLWWVPALMTLLMFLEDPMMLLNQLKYYTPQTAPTELYNDIGMVHYFYPAAAAALLFRYLHTVKASQFFHTLPVTRNELLRTKIITLWSFVLIPVLFNWAAVTIIYHTTPIGNYLDILQVCRYYGGILCTNLAMCGFAVFAATITGNTAGMIAASAGIPMVPFLIFYATQWGIDSVLHGFAGFPQALEKFCEYLTPIPADLNWTLFWFRLAEFVILHGAGILFYRSYAAERAGDLITVRWMRPIFLFGVTYCSTILGSVYSDGNGYSAVPSVLSMAAATIIGFYAAEALLQKTLRIWSSWKKLAGYAITISLILAVIQLDPIGFQTKVPAVNQVESIIFSYNPNPNEDPYYGYYEKGWAVLDESESIQKIVTLHQDMIHRKKAEEPYYNQQYITYTLKDGSQIKRKYDIPVEKANEIYNLKEYKLETKPIFQVKEEVIQSIKIIRAEEYYYGNQSDLLTVTDEEAIKQVLQAAKTDILEQDVSETETYYVDIMVPNPYGYEGTDSIHSVITNGTHIKEFLEEHKSE